VFPFHPYRVTEPSLMWYWYVHWVGIVKEKFGPRAKGEGRGGPFDPWGGFLLAGLMALILRL